MVPDKNYDFRNTFQDTTLFSQVDLGIHQIMGMNTNKYMTINKHKTEISVQ